MIEDEGTDAFHARTVGRIEIQRRKLSTVPRMRGQDELDELDDVLDVLDVLVLDVDDESEDEVDELEEVDPESEDDDVVSFLRLSVR